jgi:hypothetical protein
MSATKETKKNVVDSLRTEVRIWPAMTIYNNFESIFMLSGTVFHSPLILTFLTK